MRQTIYAAIAALMPLTAVAEGIALFPVKLLDTSQEVRDQTTDHERRLGILTDILYSELDGAKLIGFDLSLPASNHRLPACCGAGRGNHASCLRGGAEGKHAHPADLRHLGGCGVG